MPIDSMLLDPMLSTFRNMVADCKNQGIQGEDFSQMVVLLNRMEELGREHSDFNAFNGDIMNENLMGRFSDHYGRALSAQAESQQSSAEDYDDSALLRQTIDGLKMAIKQIKDSYQAAIDEAKNYDPYAGARQSAEFAKRNAEAFGLGGVNMSGLEDAAVAEVDQTIKDKPNAYDNSVEVEVMQNPSDLIGPIQDLIELGEQPGMTLPRFLKIQIEQGLDKAMEGTVVQKKSLERAVAWTKSDALSPYHIEKAERQLEVFNKLCSENQFGVPNSKELSMAHDDIDRDLEPKIVKWDNIVARTESLLFSLSFWSLSYCDFAPSLIPWSMASNPRAAVKETQDTAPGDFEIKEEQFRRYYNISFIDMFKHPSFKWRVENGYEGYSQEYVEWLIEKVYPICKPLQHLPEDLIKERAQLHGSPTGGFSGDDKQDPGKESNPQATDPAFRSKAFYDGLFGEGRFVSKFGEVKEIRTNASPWHWDSFKYGH